MRIRYIILAGLALMGMAVGMAETVSQKEAAKVAQNFLNELYGEVTAPAKMVWNGRQLTTDRLFAPFYVYNSPKGGFVMISADNKAYPVLAYSSTSSFQKDKLNEEENALLKKYAKEIELIRYDSRVPENAMSAWQNLPTYISSVINSPYSTDEYRNLSEEKKERIESIDRRNSWIVMPGAVEYAIYDEDNYRDITLDDITVEEEEDIPFSFFYDFLETARKESAAREMQLEEMLNPTKPIVQPLGGGHYTISLPENAIMMRVYSIDGAKGIEKYFPNTDVVNLNIESLPSGFYAGLVLCDSGKIYGFKLYR